MSEKKLTGYQLSRNWFDWTFENPDLVNPNHTALYFFILEHCNRLGGKEKFGLPSEMAKDGIGIKSYKTYIKTLNDLIDWGFIILHQKSTNQYSANIVAISKNTKATTKALDKAMLKHVSKHDQTKDTIVKPITLNIEHTNHKIIFEEFRKAYPGTKKGLEVEFENFVKKNKDWEEVLPKLLPAIIAQATARKKLSDSGKFVAEWKNLQTWING